MDAALSLDKDVIKKALTKSDEECLKFTVSKALGLAIVAGSSILKVPQIYMIISKGSAAGINPISYYLEVSTLFLTI